MFLIKDILIWAYWFTLLYSGDVMKIVRINQTFGESKQRSRNDGAKNGSQVDGECR